MTFICANNTHIYYTLLEKMCENNSVITSYGKPQLPIQFSSKLNNDNVTSDYFTTSSYNYVIFF